MGRNNEFIAIVSDSAPCVNDAHQAFEICFPWKCQHRFLTNGIIKFETIFCFNQVQNKATTALSPSMVETYSRLLVYPEIEGVSGHILTR